MKEEEKASSFLEHVHAVLDHLARKLAYLPSLSSPFPRLGSLRKHTLVILPSTMASTPRMLLSSTCSCTCRSTVSRSGSTSARSSLSKTTTHTTTATRSASTSSTSSTHRIQPRQRWLMPDFQARKKAADLPRPKAQKFENKVGVYRNGILVNLLAMYCPHASMTFNHALTLLALRMFPVESPRRIGSIHLHHLTPSQYRNHKRHDKSLSMGIQE